MTKKTEAVFTLRHIPRNEWGEMKAFAYKYDTTLNELMMKAFKDLLLKLQTNPNPPLPVKAGKPISKLQRSKVASKPRSGMEAVKTATWMRL